MSYTIHRLDELPASQLIRLAEIHMGDHGLLTELGFPFVQRYFEIAKGRGDTIGVYARDTETGEIIGYNIASPRPSALTSQLTVDRPWFVKHILAILLRRPAVIVQLILSSLTIQNQMAGEAEAIESLYLTIDEKHRGKKVGRTLQQALVEEARKAGYKRVVGSVEIHNGASLRMCLANGFVIKKTFREGKYLRHRIEKTL